MRFQAGDGAVDVVVDVDRFEFPIADFLPGVAVGTIESAVPLLEPDHIDAVRGRLILAIQSFVLQRLDGRSCSTAASARRRNVPLLRSFIGASKPAFSRAWREVAFGRSRWTSYFAPTFTSIMLAGTRAYATVDGYRLFPTRAIWPAGASSSTGSNRTAKEAAMHSNCPLLRTASCPSSRRGNWSSLTMATNSGEA